MAVHQDAMLGPRAPGLPRWYRWTQVGRSEAEAAAGRRAVQGAAPLHIRRWFLISAAVAVVAATIGTVILFQYLADRYIVQDGLRRGILHAEMVQDQFGPRLVQAVDGGVGGAELDSLRSDLRHFMHPISVLDVRVLDQAGTVVLSTTRARETNGPVAATSPIIDALAGQPSAHLDQQGRAGPFRLLGGASSTVVDAYMPVRDSQGTVVGVVNLFQDESQRAAELASVTGLAALAVVASMLALFGALIVIGWRAEVALKRAADEQQRLTDQLRHTERLSAIGELVSGVAHELNNPLTSVVGFAELISLRKDCPAEVQSQLNIIAREGQRMAQIVQNLLSFARARRPTVEAVDICDVLNHVLELHSYRLSVTNIAIERRFPDDLPRVEGDPNQLAQVFLNLVVNAEQAMSRAHGRGRLQVSAVAADSVVRVSVSDDGPGIPDHVRSRIFDPFFTTKPNGTGLGLSVAFGITREHHGRITLETEEGHGATFIVDLPVARTASAQAAAAVAYVNGRGARVLVVDDEPSIVHLLTAQLTGHGYAVQGVTAPEDAVALIARGVHFDAVVADLRMPGMSGQELFAAIRRDAPALARRVVFITGDTAQRDAKQWCEAARVPVLDKPVRLDQLLAALEPFVRPARTLAVGRESTA